MSTAGAFDRTVRSLALVLLLVAALGSGSALGVAAAQEPTVTAEAVATDEGTDDPLGASTLTVNVELILDSSGSMAETLPGTDQSRIEAARQALAEVIDRIPERDGLNVGFRVYGHEGSNREEDRAESCRSTELLVPIAGVDKQALRERVELFEPTGWTPLARALEAAAGDFEPGGESVTNAVIMVTDGEETCGGDPCRVAGELNAAEIALTTHVVCFALTDEQREAVACIAEDGGGELFAADDAASLSEAVFAALEQQLAITTAGYVGGNTFSLLEPCEAGELSLNAVGPPKEGIGVPVVVCNETGEDVEGVEVSLVARSADGELIGQGATLSIFPYVVVDGGVAFGNVYFGVGQLPEGAEYDDVEVASQPRSDDPLFFDTTVEEATVQEDGRIIGIVRNDHEQDVSNLRPAVACFDEAGELLEVGENVLGAADTSLAAGDETTVAFTPERGGFGLTGPCPAFLFAAQAQAALP